MKQKNFLDPTNTSLVAKVGSYLDDLRPFHGERIADVEEAVADMLMLDASEADRRLRTDLLRTFAGSRAVELPPELDPESLRVALFSEVWDKGLSTGLPEDDLFAALPEDIIGLVAQRFGITVSLFKRTMFADTPSERELVIPDGSGADVAKKAIICLNVERLRRSLRRAVRVSLQVPSKTSGDLSYVELLWGAKRLGLMYELHASANTLVMDVSGPYALFERSTMYGNRLFEFVSLVLQYGGRQWSIDAELLEGGGKSAEALRTEYLDSSLSHFFRGENDRQRPAMRSGDEEAFERYFTRLGGTWQLVYEGALIPLGDGPRRALMVPDFIARSPSSPVEVLIEIVGFWKREYLQKKIEKVRLLGNKHMMLIVNARLAAAREEIDVPRTDLIKVFFYSRREELKSVADKVVAELQGMASV